MDAGDDQPAAPQKHDGIEPDRLIEVRRQMDRRRLSPASFQTPSLLAALTRNV